MYKTVFIVYIAFLVLACETPRTKTTEIIESSELILDSIESSNKIKLDTIEQTNYFFQIDSLFEHESLDKKSYNEMSTCGGELVGYYYKDELVYLISTYGLEFGYEERKCYFKDRVLYKIIETLHKPIDGGVPEPDENGSVDWKKIIYYHEVRTILFSPDEEMTVIKDGKPITYYPESHDYYILQNKECALEMYAELNGEK